MTLIVYADANRGVSFCKKPFHKDAYVKRFCEAAEMFNQKQNNFVFYEDFRGDWEKIDKIVLFCANTSYPATEFFRFPPNRRYLLTKFKHIQGKNNLITREVYLYEKE